MCDGLFMPFVLGGVELPHQLKKISGVLYSVTYTAHKPGRYVIIVTFAGAPIQRAPFNVDIGPMKTTKIRAYGPGLESGIVGQPCPFTVVTNGEVGSLGKIIPYCVLISSV